MFQCHSPKSSHPLPLPLPQSPKDCSVHLCLFCCLAYLHPFKSVSSLNLYPASSHAGSCPPSSGRFQPQRRQHSQAREGDIMTGHHDSGMCLPPPCHILPPGHWFSFLFVCFLVFLFLPRRKSGTFARLRGLKFFKLPSL